MKRALLNAIPTMVAEDQLARPDETLKRLHLPDGQTQRPARHTGLRLLRQVLPTRLQLPRRHHVQPPLFQVNVLGQ